MSRIFIAYASQDVRRALIVHDALHRADLPSWLDLNDIPLPANEGDNPFSGLMSEVMEACDVLVVIHSRETKASTGVRNELWEFLHGADQGSIICCAFDAERPDWINKEAPGLLKETIDLSSEEPQKREAALANLTKSLAALTKNSPGPEPTDGERLVFAIQLALRAGTTAMRFFGSALVDNRSIDRRANPATLADHAAHQEVWRMHKADWRFRNERLLSEEDVEHPDVDDAFTWVVDPLDGTTNFRAGLPLFCSAVGLVKDRKPYLGVIFDPVDNRVYFGCDSKGAFLWEISLGRLRKLATPFQAPLKGCVAGTHVSTHQPKRERLIETGYLSNATSRIGSLRALGSGQLALAHVAAGKLDIFFQLDVSPWDVVAGAAIVASSRFGGVKGLVLDLELRRHWRFGSTDLVAGAKNIVNEFLTEVGMSPERKASAPTERTENPPRPNGHGPEGSPAPSVDRQVDGAR